ncbi:vanillate monooxygenase [Microtetraspora sp. NBRC 13810]|uniref:aromatic ring-hydroxylating dioxygenase subunit alpha n=1 Tax=Microtetraspora sp. NBRC 13810 TaxID=3030990 RepID=UPI0024A37922|nr:aromatic ring-hydroxylating dioxygenase subunit alpha [Microtetraspora sp. NBRC 13810]GLW05720.1 vanillate monooxygenase [Microtetraspora sp. NBRC 13810]
MASPARLVMNGWYMGAWADEVGRKLMQRWIAGRPVCFYRLLDGTVNAIEDRCPHRRFPLSLGRLDGDVIECNYHGYRIDGTGGCVGVAEQSDRPKASVHRFPLVERDGVVWIWPGDPEQADESLLPDTSWLTSPGWTHVHGVVPLKARHLLLVENLLDLTHETFLHPGSIGNAAVAATPIDVTSEGHRVSFTRHMVGIEAPPFYEKSMGLTSPIDRWQDGDFYAPGIFQLNIRLAPTGTEEPEGFHMKVLYGLTPATETETHDFFALGRDYRIHDEELSKFQLDQQLAVMKEDVDALEIQEVMVATEPDGVRESSIRSDVAGIRGRRLLEKMAAKEAGAAAPARRTRPAATGAATGVAT